MRLAQKKNKLLSQGKVSFAYEIVLQVGDHNTIGKMYYEAKGEEREKLHQQLKEFYNRQLESINKKYPHLNVLYAVIHFDEVNGTPHMHLCIQPEAEYTRGLPRKISMSRALAEDGIERLNGVDAEKKGYQMTRLYKAIREEMNQEISRYCEVKPEKHGRRHIDKSTYSDLMQEADEHVLLKENEKKQLEEEIKSLSSEKDIKSITSDISKSLYNAYNETKFSNPMPKPYKIIPEKKGFGGKIKEPEKMVIESSTVNNLWRKQTDYNTVSKMLKTINDKVEQAEKAANINPQLQKLKNKITELKKDLISEKQINNKLYKYKNAIENELEVSKHLLKLKGLDTDYQIMLQKIEEQGIERNK